MSWIDWLILTGTLLFIVIYGTIKSRRNRDIDDYLSNDHKLKWWQIGISVMATQASAVTFISVPGQAFDEGLGFIQFYLGMPIAIGIIVIFIIPIYHKLRIVTAYEYLESRFNVHVRQLTAFLFLIQRSLAAGITIYAPAIILSTVFNWSLGFTTIVIGLLVIIYTVSGGSKAVNITQQQQMAVMMIGMLVALGFVIYNVTQMVSFSDSIQILKSSGKLNIIDTKFDFKNKYNIWSGLIGGTFLALSYFGTDQSQVGRYLGGKSVKEIKMGLIFNAIFKIPMQLLILFTGAMLFIFYMYTKPPVIFNTVELSALRNSSYQIQIDSIQSSYQNQIAYITHGFGQRNSLDGKINKIDSHVLQTKLAALKNTKKEAIDLMVKQHPDAIRNDSDFMFIHFILNYMPIGMVGLLFAVILCAAMSSTSSELNALSATVIVDFYKRSFAKNKTEKHYVNASRISTGMWGLLSIGFALIFSLFDNLIEAVNIIGSLFYGVILGIFVTGFFLKQVKSQALLLAALLSEAIVVAAYYLETHDRLDFSFLWLNPLGCLAVMLFASILQPLFRHAK